MKIHLPWPFQKSEKAAMPQNPIQDKSEALWAKNLSFTLQFLTVWLFSGFLFLFLCALKFYVQDRSRSSMTIGIDLLGHGLLLALAFAAVGGLVGFLFGIPRTESQATKPPATNSEGRDIATTQSKPEQPDVKTNLEQVSDWLTKIILGAGLTQLIRVPEFLKSLGIYFEPSFGNSPFLPLIIVLNSLIFGFFAGYLITQLFLQRALTLALVLRDSTLATAIETAGTLERVKKFSAATATLEAALIHLRPDTPKSTKRDLFEKLTYNTLYEDEPEGFQKAIQYADQYIHEEPDYPSARIWVNLAAALGQKYKWDSTHDAPKEALDETRKRALEAAGNATAIEPRMKTLLRMLWNPNDPTKIQSEEDDLEVFFNDPDFKSLLDG